VTGFPAKAGVSLHATSQCVTTLDAAPELRSGAARDYPLDSYIPLVVPPTKTSKIESLTMCRSLSFVYIKRGFCWEQQPVNCRICWQCRTNRVNDYVGRVFCEASVTEHILCVILTYAPRSDFFDKVLTPKHFQDFIRSLRKAGHSLRYIVTGEYGELKGRAHFHAILFFQGPPLDAPQKTNFHTRHWPHGHVFADHDTDEKSMRYAMKYLLKSEPGKYWFSLSKKPSIGSAFFQAKAEENLRLGTFPASFEYLPPGGDRGRPYLLTGATRRDYLAAMLAPFQFGAPQEDLRRYSEWVGKAIEKTRLWQRLESSRIDPDQAINALADELDLKRPKLKTQAEMSIDTAQYTYDVMDGLQITSKG